MTPEEMREYKRQWRKKRKDDPEYKKTRSRESKSYYDRNRDEINAQRKQKYAEDEAYRERAKKSVRRAAKAVRQDPERWAAQLEYRRQRYAKLPQERKDEIQKRQYNWLKQNPEKYAKYIIRKRVERHKRYEKQIKRAIEMLGGKCQICGLVDHPIVYDFHHREPSEKSFAISDAFGYSTWGKIEKELKKCDLLCSHCHRKITHGIEPISRTDDSKKEGAN